MAKFQNVIVSNLIWRFAERCGAQVVSLVVSIILARILDPNTYGVIALMLVFISILQVFVDSGLGNALIQKKDADNVDFSTVFFTNVFFCSFLYLLLFFAAPFIASFYKNEAITIYVRVLGIAVIISGVKNVQQAYVSRNMMFKKFFFSTLGGTIVAGIVGIIMALNGFGVWALIVQYVINNAIDTIILWLTVKWRPEKAFSFERLKMLFSYGWKLLISALLDNVYSNMWQLVIGKKYSSEDLAQYNRGRHFPEYIVSNVNSSISAVLFPTLSKEQDDRDRVKTMTRRAINVSFYVMSPLMMGLAFGGEAIVELLLTEKWMPCVFYLRIFCVIFMFYPIHTANLSAIQAMGRSDLFLRLEIEKKIIGVVLLLSTMFISVEAMAWSLLVSSLISQIINSAPNKRLLGYGYLKQIRDVLPILWLSLFMGVCVYTIKMFDFSNSVTIIIQFFLGTIIYIGGSKLFHFESFVYLIDIIKTIAEKRKNMEKKC